MWSLSVMAHTRIGHLLQFAIGIELGIERGPVGINILVVQIPADGWQGVVDLYTAYSDVLEWGLFGGSNPPIYL